MYLEIYALSMTLFNTKRNKTKFKYCTAINTGPTNTDRVNVVVNAICYIVASDTK